MKKLSRFNRYLLPVSLSAVLLGNTACSGGLSSGPESTYSAQAPTFNSSGECVENGPPNRVHHSNTRYKVNYDPAKGAIGTPVDTLGHKATIDTAIGLAKTYAADNEVVKVAVNGLFRPGVNFPNQIAGNANTARTVATGEVQRALAGIGLGAVEIGGAALNDDLQNVDRQTQGIVQIIIDGHPRVCNA